MSCSASSSRLSSAAVSSATTRVITKPRSCSTAVPIAKPSCSTKPVRRAGIVRALSVPFSSSAETIPATETISARTMAIVSSASSSSSL